MGVSLGGHAWIVGWCKNTVGRVSLWRSVPELYKTGEDYTRAEASRYPGYLCFPLLSTTDIVWPSVWVPPWRSSPGIVRQINSSSFKSLWVRVFCHSSRKEARTIVLVTEHSELMLSSGVMLKYKIFPRLCFHCYISWILSLVSRASVLLHESHVFCPLKKPEPRQRKSTYRMKVYSDSRL